MVHSFDIDVAKLLGVDAAVVIENLRYWIKFNKANKRHFYNGKTWTYNSNRAFTELFPYYTSKQIRTIFEKLEAKGVIQTGNFNQSGYDRTTWYTFTDDNWITGLGNSICPFGQMEKTETANGSAQTGGPIPIDNNNLKNSSKNIHSPFQVSLTEGVILPWSSDKFIEAWLRWKNYKWKEHKFKFKSLDSEQQSLLNLTKETQFEDEAIEAINYSIGKSWKGIYLNKDFKNGKQTGSGQNGKFNGSDVAGIFDGIDKAFAER